MYDVIDGMLSQFNSKAKATTVKKEEKKLEALKKYCECHSMVLTGISINVMKIRSHQLTVKRVLQEQKKINK